MATILGLDIDPHTVRGVVLRTALRSSEVVRYIAVSIDDADASASRAPEAPALQPAPLPLDGIEPAPLDVTALPTLPEDETERVRRALRQLLGQIGTPPDRVITELSGDAVSIRKVSLPAKAAKRLAELLPFELEGKVPFDPEESVVDHQPIETVHGEMKLLASVTPKERIRSHLADMSALGLDPREVAVGAVALDGLLSLVPTLATPGPHCLIDIHVEGTDVCILQGGACHFARTLSVRIADLDGGRHAMFERELKQTLAAWRMEGGATPSAIYVCGALATRSGVDQWLGQILAAPVEVLALPPAAGADDADRPAFGRAAALAGRALARGKHLDARQGEFAAKQTVTALRQHLPLLAGCAALVVGAFLFSSYARYSVLEARHQQLEDELARVTDETFGAEARSPDQALRLLSRGARGNDPMPPFDAYDALAAISESIPEEITHDVRQLQIDLGDGEETGRFSLRGTVDNVSDTEAVLRAIEAHRVVRREGNTEIRLACFHGLELGNTTTDADDRRSYRLEGDVRCRPEGQAHDEEESGGRTRRTGRTKQ